MPGPVFMSGERVTLSTVEEEDLDAFARARSDPDVRRPLGIEFPGNRDDVEEFFEESISSDDSYWFGVVADDADGVLVGAVDRHVATTVFYARTPNVELPHYETPTSQR